MLPAWSNNHGYEQVNILSLSLFSIHVWVPAFVWSTVPGLGMNRMIVASDERLLRKDRASAELTDKRSGSIVLNDKHERPLSCEEIRPLARKGCGDMGHERS
jgi:hypothetical protein